MKKILVVDDLPEVRELVEKTLARKDCKTFTADTAEKALAIARVEKPDLIMMDIMMPGTIDGLEATRILKKDPSTSNAVVIILTAKGQPADIQKGKEAVADEYLVKPFSPLELLRKVEKILEA